MKKAFIGLLILILSAWAQYVFSAEPIQLARMNPYVAGGASAGGSCPTSETLLFDKLATDTYSNGLYVANREYKGQANFAPATDLSGSKTICSIGIGFRQTVGDVSSIDFQIEIYAMNSTSLGSAPTGTCTSSTRKITGEYPIGELKFTGLSCLLESGTLYGIVLTRSDHSYSATNYVEVFSSSSSSYTGYLASWQVSDKARTDDDGAYDISLRVYGF
jgi:hypothetical protein